MRWYLTAIFCLRLSALLPAQVSVPLNEAISGTIVDPSGAKVAGAIVDVSGDAQREITTDASGRFSFDLAAGAYHLTIAATGFQAIERDVTVTDKALPPLAVILRIATENEVVSVNSNEGASTSADSNASALVFKGRSLDLLSDNDATLQQQVLALAGGDGEHPAQVYIDGFKGGRFPPKSAIREIRINQNPYSAQYDELGFGRVEIFTKPGGDKIHGNFQLQGNNRSFNSRNPFTTQQQPAYHTLYIDGNVSGPIGKKTSFFLAGTYNDQENNAVVNATTLDTTASALNVLNISQAVPNPQVMKTFSGRLDRQLTTNNTFTARYEYNQNLVTNGGVGLLVLASQGYNNTTSTQTLQMGNTQVIGPHIVSETRFQYLRTRLQQNAVSNAPTIVVSGAFSGGGAPSQALHDSQDQYEFQEYLSMERGKHFLRMGGRYIFLRDSNLSTAGYNGQFTFPDLDTYRRALQGTANPTQFTLTAGQKSAALVTGNLGVYFEDEWKVTKNVTLDLGMRFETQTAVPDHFDPAPRLGAAWAVHQSEKHPAWMTIRGGVGLFYDRLDATSLLTTVRQNGVSQLAYNVQNPTFYPNIPPASSLTGLQPTIYRLAPNLKTSYDFTTGISVDRALGKKGNISVNYLSFTGRHKLLSRNVNAPLPGSGVRPLGGTQNIYQFSSEGVGRNNILFAHSELQPTKWAQFWIFYVNQHSNSNASTATNFASNSYNLAVDYGPSNYNVTHRLFTGGDFTLPHGFTAGYFLIARAGRRFNITTGQDNNGDTIYNDRPAFATDLTRPSVVRTAFGNFDTDPLPTQKIIPINYGTGPAYVSLQLMARKNFKIGPLQMPVSEPTKVVDPKAPTPKPTRPFELGFSVEAQNLLNHVNGGLPIGVVTSPSFGKPISLESGFFNNSAANRTITLRTSFQF
jgi:hypothetical protein